MADEKQAVPEETLPPSAQVAVALATDDEELKLTLEEAEIVKKILPQMIDRANRAAGAKHAKELQIEVDKLKADYKKVVEQQIEDLRKELTPPSPAELDKLLKQEYVEYKVPLRREGAVKEFSLRELPIAAEKRLIVTLRSTLAERIKEFTSIQWNTETTMLDRILKIADVVPGALETLADCCVVCLDPFGAEGLNRDWVLNNMGMQTMTTILIAQYELGRYRDFFSLASRVMPTLRMQ